jgi:NTP pyrophosphatase (non-canonical NTP hydrolase)
MNDIEILELFTNALTRADVAREKFGPHHSAEFACCRLAEEVGELIQAATSTSKDRDIGRGIRINYEAIDVIAMVVRLLREWPEGIEDAGLSR